MTLKVHNFTQTTGKLAPELKDAVLQMEKYLRSWNTTKIVAKYYIGF